MKKLVLVKFLFLLCFAAFAQGNGGGFEDCECDDNSFEDIVCVVDSASGEVFPIPLCFAECLELEQVECDSTVIIDPWEDCDCEETDGEEFICVLTDPDLGIICPFPSLCFAECQGYTEADVVDCGDWDNGGGEGNGGFEDCECDDADLEEIVCVLDTASGFTFPIPLCLANCFELEQVECDSTVIIDPWVDCDCEEPTEEDFICVLTDSVTGTICPFPSLCFAECQGYGEADVVDCDDWDNGGGNGGNGNGGFEDCDCEDADLEEIVCVYDSLEDFTFPIPLCLAECLELPTVECDSTVIIDPWGDCDCDMPEDDEFICVLTDPVTGIICPFPSLCFAECQGYTAEDVVECDDWDGGWTECEECAEEEYDPVCVVDTFSGEIFEIYNACYAECYGLTIAEDADCSGGNGGEDCDCDEDDFEELVCVTDSLEGMTFEIPLCLAECFGLNIVDCDSDTTGIVDTPTGTTQIGFRGGNIVNETLNLDIDLSDDAEVTINVVSMSQAVVLNRQQPMSAGSHQMTIDVSQMSEGLHLIQVSDGKEIQTMKMMIVR